MRTPRVKKVFRLTRARARSFSLSRALSLAGALTLSPQMRAVEDSAKRSRHYCFKVVTLSTKGGASGGRGSDKAPSACSGFLFGCDTAEEREQWLTCVKEIL